MGKAKQRKAVILTSALALGVAAGASAAEFELTPADLAKVEARGIFVKAVPESGRGNTVRAAVLIDASPLVIFQMITNCEQATQYVPHLRHCAVLERDPDGAWEVVEHELVFKEWYMPDIEYTFRAEFSADHSIDFRQLSGDFRANEGRYEFEPRESGTRTLLRYRTTFVPPRFVPGKTARSMYNKELPQMLANLRERCEAEQKLRAQASLEPR